MASAPSRSENDSASVTPTSIGADSADHGDEPGMPLGPDRQDPGPVSAPDEAIAGVRRRRSELKAAMNALQEAMARPSGQDPGEWFDDLKRETAALRSAFDKHVAIHEGAESFHAEILKAQPHLAPQVARLQRDHERLDAALASLWDLVERADAGEAIGVVRAKGTDLLHGLSHHRQRGADVIWRAFNDDLGGEH